MKTHSTRPTDIQREWWVVDAEGQTLGRIASQVAAILRGKNKPYYSPHLDCGDFVIIVNAEKIHATGKRMDDKRYWRYSGYPGGIRSRTLREQLAYRPERVLEIAIKGMLPKNSALGRAMYRKLKVYAGPAHPHEAQNPKPFKLVTRGKAE